MQYLYPNIPLKSNEKHFSNTWSISVAWPALHGLLKQDEEANLLVFIETLPIGFPCRIWGTKTGSVRGAGEL